jgi:RHS repeat-associated protein
MLFSGKWFDPVIGIDIHLIQPPGPVPPIPVPHPFIGIVYDPMGLAVGMAISAAMSGPFGGPFSGPVLINGLPAANTGTHVKGMPVHIPIGGVFVNPPSNEGTIITGSKTVHVLGTSGARLTSMVITCNDPVNLPTSVVMSIPMGPPVFTGGPTAVDWLAAILSAIRTKWVSDKLHEILGAESGSWRSKIICFLTGHPVDVATGRVLTDHVDFTLPGPIPFRFERHYYSASTYDGPLGRGWHHAYDQYIAIGQEGILLRSEDGRVIRFDYIEEGEAVYEPIARLDLERHRGGFSVRTADRRILRFGPEKRSDGTYPLKRLEDLNGNALVFQYLGDRLTAITDTVGRRLSLSYDGDGRLISLEAPHPDGRSRPVSVARFQYDAAGDLVAAYDALHNAYSYIYKNHLLITETDRNGLSFYFEYDDYDTHGACIHTWGTGGIYDRRLTYYNAAHLTIVETAPGTKTTYFWNDLGLVTKIIDALGGVTTLQWDNYCRKISETDPNGSTITYKYDERGNLIEVTDPLGFATLFAYDENRCPISATDQLGNVIQRQYDARANLVRFINRAGAVWLYTRDSLGRVRSLIEPNGRRLNQRYGADDGSVSISDEQGMLVSCHLDSWGRPILVEDRRGRRWRYFHDLRGKVVYRENPDGTQVQYEYDREGNLVSFTNPVGAVTTYRYGGHNKIIGVAHSGMPPVEYAYERTDEKLSGIINERGEHISIELDALGRPVLVRDFDGKISKYFYDAGGRRTRLLLPDETEIAYSYNLNNYLIEWRASDGTYATYCYDPRGLVVAAANDCGTITREYNPLRKMTKEVQGTYIVEYGFDQLGQRIWRLNHSTGRRIDYRYDDIGRLVEVSDTKDLSQHLRFDSGGKLIERRFGKSALERYDHDRNGRVRLQTVSNCFGQEVAFRRFAYDAAGSIKQVEDSQRGTTTYEYRITQELAGVSWSGTSRETLLYDTTGNLEFHSSLGRLQYDAGNRLRRAGERQFDYDGQGRVVATVENSRRTVYMYDVPGRLRAVEHPDGKTSHYEYDAFGRRISKVVGGVETRFVWDDMVLLGEEDSDGNTNEYLFVPGSFFPLMHWNNGNGFHYVLDPSGTPHEMLDRAGTVVWRGHYSTFGELLRTSVSSVSNRLRFQGQYWDSETGLHYNTYRYYDPLTSRFVTPDPLGPLGGLNSYEYAVNPINWVDPFGLMARPSGSPSPAIRNKLNNGDFGDTCAACGRKTIGPDAVAKAQAEHMTPDSEIRNMEGFDELAKADQQAVRNLEDNFTNLCQNCNASRQAKPYPEWPGHPEFPQQPGAIAQLEQDAAAAKAQIEAEIEARKPGGKSGGGCS